MQNRSRQAEISVVRSESEGVVCIDRVEAGVLKGIRLELGHQADAASFLMLVNDCSAALGSYRPHSDFQLVVAVAAQRAEHLARKTLGMNAHERRALGQ